MKSLMLQLKIARRELDCLIADARKWAMGQDDKDWLLKNLEAPLIADAFDTHTDWGMYPDNGLLRTAVSNLNRIETEILKSYGK